MKRVLIIAMLTVMAMTTRVKAEVLKGEATWYCLKGTTAIGTKTREGICSGKREWLNSTIIIWLDDGDGQIKAQNYIGMYSCEDVGGDQRIKDGMVLDLWYGDYEECKSRGRQKIIFEVIESEG